MATTATIKTGASAITVTGGTDLTFTQAAILSAGRVLKVMSDATLTLRQIKQYYKAARTLATAPNGFTQERKEMIALVPMTLANGKITNNQVGVWISHDPEASAAQKLELELIGAQMLMDGDFADFWSQGSTA